MTTKVANLISVENEFLENRIWFCKAQFSIHDSTLNDHGFESFRFANPKAYVFYDQLKFEFAWTAKIF